MHFVYIWRGSCVRVCVCVSGGTSKNPGKAAIPCWQQSPEALVWAYLFWARAKIVRCPLVQYPWVLVQDTRVVPAVVPERDAASPLSSVLLNTTATPDALGDRLIVERPLAHRSAGHHPVGAAFQVGGRTLQKAVQNSRGRVSTAFVPRVAKSARLLRDVPFGPADHVRRCI